MSYLTNDLCILLYLNFHNISFSTEQNAYYVMHWLKAYFYLSSLLLLVALYAANGVARDTSRDTL